MGRRFLVLAASLAAVLVLAAPAGAKGLSRAVIRGPGLGEPVVIRGFDVVGQLWSAAESPEPKEDHAYSSQLGPRYRVVFSQDCSPSDTSAIRVDLYPYPPEGPELFTPRRQTFCGSPISSGWAYASMSLLDTLVRHGLPAAPTGEATRSPAAAGGAADVSAPPPHLPVRAAVVAGGLIVLAVGVRAAVRIFRSH